MSQDCNNMTRSMVQEQESHSLCDLLDRFYGSFFLLLRLKRGHEQIFFAVHVRDIGWVGPSLNRKSSSKRLRSIALHKLHSYLIYQGGTLSGLRININC